MVIYIEDNCLDIQDIIIDVFDILIVVFIIVLVLVCIDQIIMIIYIGIVSFVVNYMWNFVGGIVVLGIGFGFYMVSWFMGGVKNVSLIVSENGCISSIVM